MDMTKEEYGKYLKDRQPRSPLGRDMLRAFLVGGLICTLGQGLSLLFQNAGLGAEAAGTAVSVTLVFLGAVLTGSGIYDDIARFAGAGTLVPITGFANSVVAPALVVLGWEIGIPDHLICLLRNLYAGQEATVRTGHGTTDWFQIEKGVRQGCILLLCLFNLYAECIL